ncbi:MAG: cell division protein FtsI [Deltaproteobacteria bacterium]|nr:MAG: cell division protein FtsI [Deltaproteobacteria bacterium]
MKKTQKKDNILRIKCVKYIFYICILALFARSFQIQNLSDSEKKKQIEKLYSKKISITEKRGTIFDRNGEVLAISVDAWDIAIMPQFKNNFNSYKKVASILGLKEKYVRKKFIDRNSFAFLKRKASPKEIEALKNLTKKLKADNRLFNFLKTSKRIYPNKNLAGAVIGFTNMANQRNGIEKKYNSILQGAKYSLPIIYAGKNSWYIKNQEKLLNTKRGHDIYLTIDKNIQHITESALKKGVAEFKAKSGKAIVMNPNTGEVFAMAQYPFFNPNIYGKYSPQTWNNRNVLDAFEPGSIMKIFLAAGAIEKNFCNENSLFFCQNGSYKIGNITIHDTKPHQWLPVSDIIKFSSNIGATRIAEVVGNKSFYNILKNFGFGQKTGLDVSLESPGLLRHPEKWTKVDASNISFGQGLSVSTIQLASAVSAIANNGELIKPYLVKKTVSPDGQEKNCEQKHLKKRVLSRHTAKIIKKIMVEVIKDGTAKKAKPDDYSAGGKTGTSQKLNNDGTYSKKKYISSFIGFAPADKPEIAIIIAIDEPKKNYYGGVVAAPVFKEISTKTLHYMNIIPSDIKFAMNGAAKNDN